MVMTWLSKLRMMKAYVAGDISKALTNAEKCINRDRTDLGALWTAAECSKLQGNFENAVRFGEEALSIEPKHLDTLQLLFEVCFKEKDYQRAYGYSCRAIEVVRELDASLGPYIDKVKESFLSKKLEISPLNAIGKAIEEERENTKQWVSWALKFNDWFEATYHQSSTNPPH